MGARVAEGAHGRLFLFAAEQDLPLSSPESVLNKIWTVPGREEGCLSGSDGNYTLTDKNGNSFQLTGDTAKLSEHVGHEVKVTGTASSASTSPSGGTASGTMGQTSSSSQQRIVIMFDEGTNTGPALRFSTTSM